MSAFFLLTAVRVQTMVTGLVRGLSERLVSDERGQDVVEYLGVLAVVAALITVVIGVAQKLGVPILSGASKVVSEVFNH